MNEIFNIVVSLCILYFFGRFAHAVLGGGGHPAHMIFVGLCGCQLAEWVCKACNIHTGNFLVLVGSMLAGSVAVEWITRLVGAWIDRYKATRMMRQEHE